jgi:hypothetical protein
VSGTCKECRYWYRETQGDGARNVCVMFDGDSDGDDMATPLGKYADESVLMTGPDFGCVKFMSKQDT